MRGAGDLALEQGELGLGVAVRLHVRDTPLHTPHDTRFAPSFQRTVFRLKENIKLGCSTVPIPAPPPTPSDRRQARTSSAGSCALRACRAHGRGAREGRVKQLAETALRLARAGRSSCRGSAPSCWR